MTPINHSFDIGSYTVPSGKNLYITAFQGTIYNGELKVSSQVVFSGTGNYIAQGQPLGHFENPIIVAEGEIVSGWSANNFTGFLTDASIIPITYSLSGQYQNNITYTVPSGKILVILNYYGEDGAISTFDSNGNSVGILTGYYNYFLNITGCSPTCKSSTISSPLFFDENSIIETGGYNTINNSVINGYLMDK